MCRHSAWRRRSYSNGVFSTARSHFGHRSARSIRNQSGRSCANHWPYLVCTAHEFCIHWRSRGCSRSDGSHGCDWRRRSHEYGDVDLGSCVFRRRLRHLSGARAFGHSSTQVGRWLRTCCHRDYSNIPMAKFHSKRPGLPGTARFLQHEVPQLQNRLAEAENRWPHGLVVFLGGNMRNIYIYISIYLSIYLSLSGYLAIFLFLALSISIPVSISI